MSDSERLSGKEVEQQSKIKFEAHPEDLLMHYYDPFGIQVAWGLIMAEGDDFSVPLIYTANQKSKLGNAPGVRYIPHIADWAVSEPQDFFGWMEREIGLKKVEDTLPTMMKEVGELEQYELLRNQGVAPLDAYESIKAVKQGDLDRFNASYAHNSPEEKEYIATVKRCLEQDLPLIKS